MTEVLKDLPLELERAMFAFARRGRAAWQTGDLATAEVELLRSWEIIPAPYSEWLHSAAIISGLLAFYVETGQHGKALEWYPAHDELCAEDSWAELFRQRNYRTA